MPYPSHTGSMFRKKMEKALSQLPRLPGLRFTAPSTWCDLVSRRMAPRQGVELGFEMASGPKRSSWQFFPSCNSAQASLTSYSTSSMTITLPYTSSHYSIFVERPANKVDNIIQVRRKSLKEIPESDNSLSLPLSLAPLHSSPQWPMPFSPAHLQLDDATVLYIFPSSALSPSKNLMSRWPHYAIHSTQAFSVLISKQASGKA